MWDVIKKNKFSIGLLVIIIIGAVVYSIFFLGAEAPSDSADQPVVQNARVGEEIFQLVERLERIDLEPTIFGRAAFASLRDFGYAPRQRNVSRPDPFAPIGNAPSDDGVVRQ
ncbi:MAG: hypothetical protein WD049_02200 [Candidatus Paceibacterota bacterium]